MRITEEEKRSFECARVQRKLVIEARTDCNSPSGMMLARSGRSHQQSLQEATPKAGLRKAQAWMARDESHDKACTDNWFELGVVPGAPAMKTAVSVGRAICTCISTIQANEAG